MKLWNKLSMVLAFLYIIPLTGVAQQNEASTIVSLLKSRDQEIKSLLTSSETTDNRERLKSVINANIDFTEMARLSLGPFWDSLSTEQRQEFVEVFSEIVREHSLSNLDIYRAKVRYDSVQVYGDSARAYTTAIYKDTPVQVIYVLKKKGDRWVVVDLILDGVSTVEGYARSFQGVIRKRGFDTLMRSLRKKLRKITASKTDG